MDDTTIIGDGVVVAQTPAQAGWAAAWSGVSWSAVIAGALTAIAVSVIVIALGSGIGMSVVSPYSSSSPSTETMTIIGALWLVFAQAVGFAVGGYVAGRLRWAPAPLHSTEVKFRDGANGLVVWAIGVVVISLILAAAVGKAGSAASNAIGGTAALGIAGSQSQSPSLDYFTDALLRPNPQSAANGGAAAGSAPAGAATGAGAPGATAPNGGNNTAGNNTAGNNNMAERQQVYRIMQTAVAPGGLSNDDRTYLAQVIAAQTGMSQNDAQHRVDDVVNRAKQDATQAADTARKAAEYLSFWTFLSLLFGAVCATLGGMLGGDLRDENAVTPAVTTVPR